MDLAIVGFREGVVEGRLELRGLECPRAAEFAGSRGRLKRGKVSLETRFALAEPRLEGGELGDPADEASDLRGVFGNCWDFARSGFAAPDDDDLGDFLTSEPPGESGSSKPPRSMSRFASMRSASSRDLSDVSDLRAVRVSPSSGSARGYRRGRLKLRGLECQPRCLLGRRLGVFGEGARLRRRGNRLRYRRRRRLEGASKPRASGTRRGGHVRRRPGGVEREVSRRQRRDDRAASAPRYSNPSAALFSALALTRSVCECAAPCSAAAALVAARRSASMADALAAAAAPVGRGHRRRQRSRAARGLLHLGASGKITLLRVFARAPRHKRAARNAWT